MFLPSISIRAALAAVNNQPLYRHPSAFLWQRCLSISNQFCHAVVNAGLLTWEQMVNAACRYCVGASKKGGVIFWQIDNEGRVRDGKVMYYLPDCHRNKSKNAHPTWVSTILARRHESSGRPGKGSYSNHCFFGTHLLMPEVKIELADAAQQCAKNALTSSKRAITSTVRPLPVVAVVEAEKSAFILSELYPKYIWLASGGLGEVQPDKFRPLRGHKVILFPDTDPDGIAFRRWTEAANLVMNALFWEDSPPIRVSPLLELHATPDQKARKIDLVDFYFESTRSNPHIEG